MTNETKAAIAEKWNSLSPSGRAKALQLRGGPSLTCFKQWAEIDPREESLILSWLNRAQ
jgi:hypothetical protein